MTRREVAAIIALLAAVLFLAAFWPAPRAAGDTPILAPAVSASVFVPVQPVAGTPRPIEKPTPSPSASSMPASMPVRSPAQRVVPAVAVTGHSAIGTALVAGIASWFASPIGVSAAGPALRAALGSNWRGTLVKVTGPHGFAWTILGDWCGCTTAGEKLIDLDVNVFPVVCGPLSRGICEVKVTW